MKNISILKKQQATGLPKGLKQNWCGYQRATVRLLGLVAKISKLEAKKIQVLILGSAHAPVRL